MEAVAVDVAEFAEAFRQSPDTIYRLMDRGVIPELPRWSRRRLIPRAFVDRVIAESMDQADAGRFLESLRDAS